MLYFDYLISQLRVWHICNDVPLFKSVVNGSYFPPAAISPQSVNEHLEFLLKSILNYGC